jgi:hypothetical protein
MLISTALTYGFVMATILAVFVLVSLSQNPRMWLDRRGTPEAIRQLVVPPLKDEEKRLLKLWMLPFFGVTLLMPLGVALWYEATYQPMSYGEAFLFFWMMWMVFNLVDLVIIDWFVLVWWQPSWAVIPEVKPLTHLIGYGYHLKASLKGTVLLAAMALIYAGILMFI